MGHAAKRRKKYELTRPYAPPWEDAPPRAPEKLRPIKDSAEGKRKKSPKKRSKKPSFPFQDSRADLSLPADGAYRTPIMSEGQQRDDVAEGAEESASLPVKSSNYSSGFKVLRCTPTVQNPFPPGAQHGLLTPRSEAGDGPEDQQLSPRMMTPRSARSGKSSKPAKKKTASKKKKKVTISTDKLPGGGGGIYGDPKSAATSPRTIGADDNVSDFAGMSGEMTYEVSIHLMGAMGMRSKSNTYAILQVNNRRVVSQIAYNSVDPKWSEQFFFVFERLDWPCRVVVRDKIVDQPMDEFMGELAFNLADWIDYDEHGSVQVDEHGITHIEKVIPLSKRGNQPYDVDPSIHIEVTIQTLYNGVTTDDLEKSAKEQEMQMWKTGFKRRLDASLSNYKRSRTQSIVAQHPEFFEGSTLLPGLFGVTQDLKKKRKSKRSRQSSSRGSIGSDDRPKSQRTNTAGTDGGLDESDVGNSDEGSDEEGSKVDQERRIPCWIRWNKQAMEKKAQADEREKQLALEEESHSPLRVPNRPFSFYTKDKERVMNLRKTYPGICKEDSLVLPHLGGIMKPKKLAPLKKKHALPEDRPTMRWMDVMGEIKKPSRRKVGKNSHATRNKRLEEEEKGLIITRKGLTFNWPHGAAGVEEVRIADEPPSPRGGNPRGYVGT